VLHSHQSAWYVVVQCCLIDLGVVVVHLKGVCVLLGVPLLAHFIQNSCVQCSVTEINIAASTLVGTVMLKYIQYIYTISNTSIASTDNATLPCSRFCFYQTTQQQSELSAAITSRGGKFLEAPVSGSKGPAEAGTLVFLCGGMYLTNILHTTIHSSMILAAAICLL
jgi:NAD binding domain of 6-phosphogluconate dehydrogenase